MIIRADAAQIPLSDESIIARTEDSHKMLRRAVIENEYRYVLERIWLESIPALNWVMLNPSKANGEIDDPTVNKIVGFSTHLGYGGCRAYNLFAYRSTHPNDLSEVDDPIGPKNNAYLLELAAAKGETVIFAWGSHKMPEGHKRRPGFVIDLFSPFLDEDQTIRVYCLGRCKDGSPKHPLMIPYSTRLEHFYGW